MKKMYGCVLCGVFFFWFGVFMQLWFQTYLKVIDFTKYEKEKEEKTKTKRKAKNITPPTNSNSHIQHTVYTQAYTSVHIYVV